MFDASIDKSGKKSVVKTHLSEIIALLLYHENLLLSFMLYCIYIFK